MKNGDNEADLLHLWSWQTPDFSLIKGTVDHRKSEKEKTVPGLRESRIKLSEHLGTVQDQFIWCATNSNPNEKWPDRIRWKLEVPKQYILAYTCNVAWHWILAHNGNNYNNPIPPERLWHLARFHTSPPRLNWIEFCKRFNDSWRTKTPKQLWDALFVDKVYGDCTDVLLRHPIEEGWVKNDFDK